MERERAMRSQFCEEQRLEIEHTGLENMLEYPPHARVQDRPGKTSQFIRNLYQLSEIPIFLWGECPLMNFRNTQMLGFLL